MITVLALMASLPAGDIYAYVVSFALSKYEYEQIVSDFIGLIKSVYIVNLVVSGLWVWGNWMLCFKYW